MLSRTLPHVDLFTPSVEELTLMLRRSRFDDLARQAVNSELLGHIDGQLLADLADQCIAYGAAVVVIKCGWFGLYIRTADKARFARGVGRGLANPEGWAGRELFEPGYKVDKVVSATGAGDCAIAAFLTACLRGCSLEDAARFATAVGAQNVTAADSISGVKSWEQTAATIAARPPKYDIPLPLKGFTFDAAQQHFTGPRDRA